MIANGLTKALGRTEFEQFLKQINLTDISDLLQAREEALQSINLEEVVYPLFE